MIPTGALSADGTRTKVTGQSMRSRGMCAKERFSEQPTAAMCSGFLVGPKLLVTAGHCIQSMSDCQANRWVFDYKMENAGSVNISVPTSSVYTCTKILSQSLEGGNGDDYAIVELDRAVTGREVLKTRTSGTVAVGTEIVVIGHPTGLPTKIADGAKVRKLTAKYFVANLDTYGGNSGSAVFDAKTGVVEGILVRGENDYVRDNTLGCRVSNYCPDTGCRGEDVTLITNVPGIKKKK
jgi:V8-like Glu-specific endopeptidase